MFLVKTIITKLLEKLNSELTEFFSEGGKRLDEAEVYCTNSVSAAVAAMLGAYYEEQDAQFLADKAGRRAEGLVVERRGDVRRVLTRVGMVEFRRTYYAQKSGGYSYPIDAVAGLEGYQRVSNGVSQGLVAAAREMSYAKSSWVVTGGQVSRQTVLHKIRQARSQQEAVTEPRHVAALHIDADEDHVKLQDGSRRIVPLVSVYEGIERNGRRGSCKNVFHWSSFGQSTDVFWEDVVSELERRYDLRGTKIYLHGDGAPWIRSGLEWLPNSVFVLDQYHKNKALKGVVSGIERKVGCQYEVLLRRALRDGDCDFVASIRDSMLLRWPERQEQIWTNTQYLLDHFKAIRIYDEDPEARNGGATEPHVSHVLSARLSSRPMAWSKDTLMRFVPILATGRFTLETENLSIPRSLRKHIQPRIQSRPGRFMLGAPDPDKAVRLPARAGKVTPLFTALQPFFG